MSLKKMDLDGLPRDICCHILSFFPTKEAASTSVLSRKWRDLFASVPNLDLDDSVYLNPCNQKEISTSFMDFVDRVLALQGNSPLHKFSLKIGDGVDPARITPWIHNVLERGVSDLDLNLDLESEFLLPSKVFQSKTLVKLKLKFGLYPTFDVEDDVHLPNLKTLNIHPIHFEEHGIGLTKLLSGCHMLEDLVLDDVSWFIWDFASVSVSTLKRLTFCWEDRDEFPKSLSFDTPIVYLKYTDTVAGTYPKVNFKSLVEAHIDLRLLKPIMVPFHGFLIPFREGYGEDDMVGNATDLLMGLCNVKTLYLSANTLQVLSYSCNVIPIFNNLTHLTIESNPEVGWQSLPGLLKNSPNLETLIFQGLLHKATDRCGDVCLCKPCEENIPSCLSTSSVKVLKIKHFYDDDMGKQRKQIKHFLETMPNLEKMILYFDTPIVKHVTKVSHRLLRLASKVASSKCVVLLISKNISLVSNKGLASK